MLAPALRGKHADGVEESCEKQIDPARQYSPLISWRHGGIPLLSRVSQFFQGPCYAEVASEVRLRKYSRRAALTAASSVNAAATSSANRTTRSRSLYRARYIPRTASRGDRKSYSGRRPSLESAGSGEVANFVVPAFGLERQSAPA
jgi:hypothetical protein